MKLVIPKINFSQILFILSVAVPYLNSYELTFAVWSGALILSITQKYSLTILKQVFCFTAILVIGFIVSFFKEYEMYFFIRDFTYIIKPVIGLLLGYQLCKKNLKFNNGNIFSLLVYTALFIAVVHLIVVFFTFLKLRSLQLNDLRYYSGYFSDFEVYGLVILFFSKQFNLELTRKKQLILICIIGFSVFLYFSRTNFIQFVILFIGLKGYLKINKRSIKVILSVIILSVIGYSTILYINPKRNGKGIEAFLYKIKVAPIEPFKTKIKRDDWKDFNDNYRSYENVRTVQQVTRKGTFSIIFGEGLGSKIDLKQKIWLGDMELQYISILHNGFMTVYLKSGLLGIFFLLYSIFLMFKTRKSEIPIVRNINLLIVASGLFLIVSYWVFMGYYFVADTKSIVIGFLIAYSDVVIKKGQLLMEKND